MIVDTHAHPYSQDDPAYPPVAEPYRPPKGAGSPEHLRREMREAGVDRAMLIQTFTYYGFDNSFVRDTAMGAGAWAAGAVNLDPQHPHSADALYAMVKRANIRAIRVASMPYGRYDLPGVRRLYAEALGLGIVVNALCTLEDAEPLAGLLADFPRLPVVLDHCFSLTAGDLLEPSVKKVVELARIPNLHAKLSFLPMGSAEEYPFRDMHDALRRILRAFGPERCIWGSDFPTQLFCPKVTYAGHLRLFQEELGLTSREQEHILETTPARLYFGAS